MNTFFVNLPFHSGNKIFLIITNTSFIGIEFTDSEPVNSSVIAISYTTHR